MPETLSLTATARVVNGAVLIQARGRMGTVWVRFAGNARHDAETTLLARWHEVLHWGLQNMPKETGPATVLLAGVRFDLEPVCDGIFDAKAWSYATLQGWVHRAQPAIAA